MIYIFLKMTWNVSLSNPSVIRGGRYDLFNKWFFFNEYLVLKKRFFNEFSRLFKKWIFVLNGYSRFLNKMNICFEFCFQFWMNIELNLVPIQWKNEYSKHTNHCYPKGATTVLYKTSRGSWTQDTRTFWTQSQPWAKGRHQWKKNVFFRALPEWGKGGSTYARIFWPFFEKCIFGQ